MSLAKSIAIHLPYLRRFARSLSGSQQSGDAYVGSTLEAILQDQSIFPLELTPRVALYHIFMRLWTSISVNIEPYDWEDKYAPQRRLNLLTPRSRQAFLLHLVEGFSIDDTAVIIGSSKNEVLRLIQEAEYEIARQVATSVLIIEDEPLIAMDIQALVQDLGHSVIGVARTHKEAVAMANSHRPGIVLADIELADGSSGLEAVNDILQKIEVPVIFITGYPERLATGERPEPTFFISKPFQTDMVKAVISQALLFNQKAKRNAA